MGRITDAATDFTNLGKRLKRKHTLGKRDGVEIGKLLLKDVEDEHIVKTRDSKITL